MGELTSKIFKRYILIWILSLLIFIGLAYYSYVEINAYKMYQVAKGQNISQFIEGDSIIGLVFGAAITPDGEPRSVLSERLETAYELYKAGFIDRVHVSGYNDTINNDYNEPRAMVNYLVTRGVARQDINVDVFGDSTFMTCQNAKQVFDIDEAILITQPSHMNRALYSCHQFGMQAYGYQADAVESNWNYWHQAVREIFGNIKAVIETRTDRGLYL